MIKFIENILETGGLSQLVAYVLVVISLGQIYFLFYKKSILKDLRGDDTKWQFLEVSGIVWIILFPAIVLSSLFSDKHYPPEVWTTMDIIYLINVLGKRADKFIEARYATLSGIVKETIETKKTTETVTKKDESTTTDSQTEEAIK